MIGAEKKAIPAPNAIGTHGKTTGRTSFGRNPCAQGVDE